MGMFDDMMEQQKKLSESVNYKFCNMYLPSLFFYKPEIFIGAITDGKKAYQILTVIFDIMKKDGLDITPLMNTIYRGRVDSTKKVAGIVFELPNPKLELECNFVAIVFFDKEPQYFESELYDDGTFGLCGRSKDGNHINYGKTGGDIRTYDDMWSAIISMK